MKIIKYYATVKKDEAEGCKKNGLLVLHWFKIYYTENNALVMTNNKVFHHDNLTVKATDSEQKMVDKVFQKSVNRLLEVGFDTSRISLLSLVDKEANKYHLQHLHHIHITREKLILN